MLMASLPNPAKMAELLLFNIRSSSSLVMCHINGRKPCTSALYLGQVEIDKDPGQKVKRFREDPASFGDNISWEEKGGTYSGCWGWGTGVEEEMEGRVHPLGLRRRRRWGRRAVSRAATMPATRKARTATSQGRDMANAGGCRGWGLPLGYLGAKQDWRW